VAGLLIIIIIGWRRDSVLERRSLTGELSLIYAWSMADM